MTPLAHTDDAASPAPAPRGIDRRLLWLLAVAALVRLAFFLPFQDLPLKMDEIQYQELAVNLVEGRGFALNGKLTSWRPPLYSAMLAGLYAVTGTTDPSVARALQAVLSLVTVVLTFAVARRFFGPRAALIAAGVVAFYPSLLFYNNHVLTEILFTLLVTLTVWCFVRQLERPGLGRAVATGLALGAAVLTRDIIWPMGPVMVLIAAWVTPGRLAVRAAHGAALLAAFLLVVTPWAVRNTRLQGTTTFIATNGGIVFMEGNYEHTPLDRSWRAHALDSELKVRRFLPTDVTEGVRQKLAFRYGIDYALQHPSLTVRRSLVKAANVWGLEREITGTLLNGSYGRVPQVAILGVTVAIMGVYALTMLAAVIGLCAALARGGAGMPLHVFTAIFVVYYTAAHALVFGHPRYHLPLMPLLTLYAASAWASWPRGWAAVPHDWPRRVPAVAVASVVAAVLVAIWAREVFFVDLHRFLAGLAGA
jgi:4-amino-4-deoxy-L-arabinose transferase-like glycosyltransferase